MAASATQSSSVEGASSLVGPSSSENPASSIGTASSTGSNSSFDVPSSFASTSNLGTTSSIGTASSMTSVSTGTSASSAGASTASSTMTQGSSAAPSSSAGNASSGAVAGGTCASPALLMLGQMVMGDTTGRPSEVDGTCQFGPSAESVFLFNPTQSGIVELRMLSDADLGLHVNTTCSAADETQCRDGEYGGLEEVLRFPVTSNNAVLIFVDGYDVGDEGAFSLTIHSHVVMCGDGDVEGSEECEPPNTASCDGSCHIPAENCTDGVDNDGDESRDCADSDCSATPACTMACMAAPALMLPMTNGSITAGAGVHAGSCLGDGNETVFSYMGTSNAFLELTLASAADLGVYVRTACDGPELGCIDAFTGGHDEVLAVRTQPGQQLFVLVDAYDADQAGPFTITSRVRPINESEPNNLPAMANMLAMPFVGMIEPEGDVDVVRVPVTAGQHITAAVDGLTECTSAVDPYVTIYAPDGTTVITEDDDAGDLYCSLATTGTLAAGTYYVAVKASALAEVTTFAYALTVTVQ